jgi:hypothetical protein
MFLVEESADYHRCPFGCKTHGMPYMARAQPEVEAAILIHSAFHIAASKVARSLLSASTPLPSRFSTASLLTSPAT